MKLTAEQLRDFLDQKVEQFNGGDFIATDPVSIPHRYAHKGDREIAAFFAAILAWGNRKSILNSAADLMRRMDDAPLEFILHHGPSDLKRLNTFVHRTFNGHDARYFVQSLQSIYSEHPSMEVLFAERMNQDGHTGQAIHEFRSRFLYHDPKSRTAKHISDPLKNSAAKRIQLFLRWMVRKDNHGVDFGIWNTCSTASLCIPLDVHVGNVARSLGLLKRQQHDWKSVMELTENLRKFDPLDPIKYDFALFGLGVFEDW